MTGGEVFHDGLGDLGRIRTALAYYPREVWLYVRASQWQRIAQEEVRPTKHVIEVPIARLCADLR